MPVRSPEIPTTTIRGRLDAMRRVNYEATGHSRLHYEVSALFMEFIRMYSRITVEGEEDIPKEGPAIIIVNHASMADPVLLHWIVGYAAERTIRTTAKRTLIDPYAVESKKAIKRRTQEDKPIGELPLPMQFIRGKVFPWYVTGFNPIPIDIGGDNKEAIKRIIGELKGGRLVGYLPQGTRKPELDLVADEEMGMLEGLAILMARILPNNGLIDVPIIPIGISGSDRVKKRGPVAIRVGKAFNYSQIKAHMLPGESRINAVNRHIGDRLAGLIDDPSLKSAWRLTKLGLSPVEVKEIYKRGYPKNPNLSEKDARRIAMKELAIAANLAEEYMRSYPSATREEIKDYIGLIDECAVFSPPLEKVAA